MGLFYLSNHNDANPQLSIVLPPPVAAQNTYDIQNMMSVFAIVVNSLLSKIVRHRYSVICLGFITKTKTFASLNTQPCIISKNVVCVYRLICSKTYDGKNIACLDYRSKYTTVVHTYIHFPRDVSASQPPESHLEVVCPSPLSCFRCSPLHLLSPDFKHLGVILICIREC